MSRSSNSSRPRNKKSNIIIVLCLFIALVCVCGIFFIKGYEGRIKDQQDKYESMGQSQAVNRRLEYDGKSYVYNSNLKNILFIGEDFVDENQASGTIGAAGQSDAMILISVDNASKKGTLLSVNRNTMMELDVYDMNGKPFSTRRAQLALQYAYAPGGMTSCQVVSRKVSSLLYDMPVDYYISVNMANISTINDILGGITIKLDDDYTYIDESYKKDTEITLMGKDAERFVRYRDTDEFDSNTKRMQRQKVYITALIEKLKAMAGSAEKAEDIYNQISAYMTSNLTAEEFGNLADYDYAPERMLNVPGETKVGEIYEEYIVDMDALKKIVVDNYYK